MPSTLSRALFVLALCVGTAHAQQHQIFAAPLLSQRDGGCNATACEVGPCSCFIYAGEQRPDLSPEFIAVSEDRGKRSHKGNCVLATLTGNVGSGCSFTGDAHICGSRIAGVFDFTDPVENDCDTAQTVLPFGGRIGPQRIRVRYVAGD